MMTDDNGMRKASMITLNKFTQCTDLFRSTRVSGDTVLVQPTLVADADRIFVMPHTVGTDLPKRTTCIDRTVAGHPEMIADALPSLGLVVVVNFLDTVVLIGSETITMQHDHRNFPHKSLY